MLHKREVKYPSIDVSEGRNRKNMPVRARKARNSITNLLVLAQRKSAQGSGRMPEDYPVQDRVEFDKCIEGFGAIEKLPGSAHEK
jgi:hypothetical protein